MQSVLTMTGPTLKFNSTSFTSPLRLATCSNRNLACNLVSLPQPPQAVPTTTHQLVTHPLLTRSPTHSCLTFLFTYFCLTQCCLTLPTLHLSLPALLQKLLIIVTLLAQLGPFYFCSFICCTSGVCTLSELSFTQSAWVKQLATRQKMLLLQLYK